jgi:hypothetical protein
MVNEKKTKPGRQAERKCPERQREQFTSNTFKAGNPFCINTRLHTDSLDA